MVCLRQNHRPVGEIFRADRIVRSFVMSSISSLQQLVAEIFPPLP
jgi:hypothetical protein